MTLEQYRNSRYEDLFLAVIKKELDWNQAEQFLLTIPNSSYKVTAHDLLKIAVEEALRENGEPLTEENKKMIEEEVKQAITPHLEEWEPVILLKQDEGFVDLSRMEELDKEYKIICQISFSEYYGKYDYFFDEDENGPYLIIDMGPFEEFVKDYERGKII